MAVSCVSELDLQNSVDNCIDTRKQTKLFQDVMFACLFAALVGKNIAACCSHCSSHCAKFRLVISLVFCGFSQPEDMLVLMMTVMFMGGEARSPPCAFDGRGYTDIHVNVPSGHQFDASSCQKECQLRIGCSYFTFYNNSQMCWLMGATATLMDQPDPKATSGSKTCSSGVTPGAVITLPGDEAVGATLRDGFPTASTPALEASLEQIHHNAEDAYKKISNMEPREIRSVGVKNLRHQPRGRGDENSPVDIGIIALVLFIGIGWIGWILFATHGAGYEDPLLLLLPIHQAQNGTPGQDSHKEGEASDSSDASPVTRPFYVSDACANGMPVRSVRDMLTIPRPLHIELPEQP